MFTPHQTEIIAVMGDGALFHIDCHRQVDEDLWARIDQAYEDWDDKWHQPRLWDVWQASGGDEGALLSRYSIDESNGEMKYEGIRSDLANDPETLFDMLDLDESDQAELVENMIEIPQRLFASIRNRNADQGTEMALYDVRRIAEAALDAAVDWIAEHTDDGLYGHACDQCMEVIS